MKHLRPLTCLPAVAGPSINDITEFENFLAVITQVLFFLNDVAKTIREETQQ